MWSSSLPYLHSVETPEGEDSVPNYYSVSTFSPEEFREIFLAAHGDADLSGDPAEWFRDRTVNDSGRVERVTIGGVERGGDGGAAAVLPALSVLHRWMTGEVGRCLSGHGLRSRRGHEPVRS